MPRAMFRSPPTPRPPCRPLACRSPWSSARSPAGKTSCCGSPSPTKPPRSAASPHPPSAPCKIAVKMPPQIPRECHLYLADGVTSILRLQGCLSGQWSCIAGPRTFYLTHFNLGLLPPKPSMLTCIGNVTNPLKLRAIEKQHLLKGFVIFAVARVLARMLVVPNPVLDMPRRKGGHDCLAATGFRLKTLVGGQHNFIPKFSRGRETEVHILNNPTASAKGQGRENLIVAGEHCRVWPPYATNVWVRRFVGHEGHCVTRLHF